LGGWGVFWCLARELVNLIYDDFRKGRDFVFRDQITGAGISVMNNISGGFCRSNSAEFRQFLKISRASAGEIKNLYYIAEDQKYVTSQIAEERRLKYQRIINGYGSLKTYFKSRSKIPGKPARPITSQPGLRQPDLRPSNLTSP